MVTGVSACVVLSTSSPTGAEFVTWTVTVRTSSDPYSSTTVTVKVSVPEKPGAGV